MREKNIENKIKSYLKSKGAYYVKYFGNSFSQVGVPDILACYKGRFIGIEVKAPTKLNNQSEYQKIHMKNILDAGGIYILANKLDLVKEVIENI